MNFSIKSKSILPILIIATWSLWSASSQAAVLAGEVNLTVSEASADNAGDIRAISKGAKVYKDEDIITGDESASVINLIDESVLTLGENSRLTLDDMVVDTGTGSDNVTLNLIEGVMLFTSGKLPSQSYNISLRGIPIGIRGTAFYMGLTRGALSTALSANDQSGTVDGVLRDEAFISVVEGTVEIEIAGTKHTLNAGQSLLTDGEKVNVVSTTDIPFGIKSLITKQEVRVALSASYVGYGTWNGTFSHEIKETFDKVRKDYKPSRKRSSKFE